MCLSITDDLDLKQIAESGQCFRWEQIEDNGYRIIHGGYVLYISQRSPGEFQLDCEEEEFRNVWAAYFDLDTDYRGIRQMIDRDSDPFLYAAAEQGKGIRILRQDPWEITVSFIISQNRNIPAIKRSVERLCSLAGKRLADKRGEEYFSFPAPEDVLRLSKEEIAQCRLGYRDKYVLSAAKAASCGDLSPERLGPLPDDELLRRLGMLYGVGPKVASCIALFGFHRLDAFPVDTWIRKALVNEYPGGFPFDRYRPYNGVFQQYIFSFCRNASSARPY